MADLTPLLWTDGTSHLVATGRGLACLRDGQTLLHRFTVERSRRGDEPAPPEFLAVMAADGSRALFGRGGTISEWTLADGAPVVRELATARTRGAIIAADGRLLACIGEVQADGRERAVLAVASTGADQLALATPMELPEPTRIAWPGGIWASGKVPWPEEQVRSEHELAFEPRSLDVKTRKGAWQGSVRLHANRAGVVVTSSYSGLLVRLDPATLAPQYVIRLPVQADTEVFGVATEGGVLAVICLGGRESTVLNLSSEGEVIAHRSRLGRDPAWGLRRPLLLGADVALVTHAYSGSKAYTLSLPDLEARRAPDVDDLAIVAHASAGDSSCHLVVAGDPRTGPHDLTLHALRTERARCRSVALEMPDFRSPERTPAAAPTRMGGAPSIGLVARPGLWSCVEGEDIELVLTVASKGGVVPGFWVEVGGPAYEGSLVRPIQVSCKAATSTFAERGKIARAEVVEVSMEAAFQRVDKSKPGAAVVNLPDPTCDVTIRARGLRAGQALLMVRIGPLGVSTAAGSAMQGRSLTVS